MIATLETKTGLPLLRLALTADAVVTGANGLIYLGAGNLLDDVLGPQARFLQLIGAFLIVFAIGVGALATRTKPNPLPVIAANAAWVVASLTYAATSDALTTIGTVWTILQAGVVAGFAALQIMGLRRL